jgi:hypothetical protein
MEQSPSWEADSCSASQYIPRILSKSKFNYRVRYDPQLKPLLTLTYYTRILVFNINCNIVLSSSTAVTSLRFRNKLLYTILISQMRASCPAHLTLLDLIILIR